MKEMMTVLIAEKATNAHCAIVVIHLTQGRNAYGLRITHACTYRSSSYIFPS